MYGECPSDSLSMKSNSFGVFIDALKTFVTRTRSKKFLARCESMIYLVESVTYRNELSMGLRRRLVAISDPLSSLTYDHLRVNIMKSSINMKVAE